MIKLRLTEHTNTDDAYCVITFLDGPSQGQERDFLGDIDEFRGQLDPAKFVIAEEVWD